MIVPFMIPPGLNTDDTDFVVHPGMSFGSQPPGYVDMDKARFWRGLPQTIGGWESFVAAPLTGVCRNIHAWSDLTATLNVAFGTHSNLEVVLGGVLSDITPVLALPSLALGANPLTTQGAGSPNVTVAQNGHPYLVGESVNIAGAAAVGGITPNGTFAITATTPNSWTYAFSSNATSGATGGGAAVVVTPQRAFAAGAIDGTGGAGYGTGTYSTGTYSQPSTVDYFPRTWSLSNYGQTLIANPRGGPIYQWNNVTATPPAPLPNSPARVTASLITPDRQAVAIGCNQVLSGVFNPMCIRGSDLEDLTSWFPTTSNNAFEDVLEGGGRLVNAHMVGDFMFVWSDTCLWQGQFIGDPSQTWRWTRLGESCGLIGPNAVAVVGQSAFWMSPDGNFRTCALNGEPQLLLSSVQTDIFNNLAPSQQDKIICAEIPKYGEVWWLYPDARDGSEVSRYIGLSLMAGTWLHGTFDRTAFHKGSPAPYPIGVSKGGSAYYHEKGQSADGGVLSWFWESGGQFLGNAEQRFTISRFYPDFEGQVGPVTLTVFLRDYPQGTDRIKGPFSISPGQKMKSFMGDGRIARIRVAGSSVPAFCRQGRPQFEGVGSGMQ